MQLDIPVLAAKEISIGAARRNDLKITEELATDRTAAHRTLTGGVGGQTVV
jgi:hypothetical protein